MALEALTGSSVYINALNASNPPGGDDRSEGDNHIRGIKNVILNTFPNINGAVNPTPTEFNRLVGITSALLETGGNTQLLTKALGFSLVDLGATATPTLNFSLYNIFTFNYNGNVTLTLNNKAAGRWGFLLGRNTTGTNYTVTWPGTLGTDYTITGDVTSFVPGNTWTGNAWLVVCTNASYFWTARIG